MGIQCVIRPLILRDWTPKTWWFVSPLPCHESKATLEFNFGWVDEDWLIWNWMCLMPLTLRYGISLCEILPELGFQRDVMMIGVFEPECHRPVKDHNNCYMCPTIKGMDGTFVPTNLWSVSLPTVFIRLQPYTTSRSIMWGVDHFCCLLIKKTNNKQNKTKQKNILHNHKEVFFFPSN